MVRETPFHLGHLRAMVAVTEMGAIVAPPIPGLNHRPQSVEDLVDHSVNRVLDLIGCPNPARSDGMICPMPTANKLLVAFQGEPGAFSHAAARKLLGSEIKIVPCVRFADVFRALKRGPVTHAVLPIENTLHGSVHENYDHLLEYQLPIVGETSIRISHQLIAMPGTRFRDVRRVLSHPVALNQCLRFFEDHPDIEKVPHYDTAGA